jgi:hypothetical protein
MAAQSWGKFGAGPYEPKRTPPPPSPRISLPPRGSTSPYDAGTVRTVGKSGSPQKGSAKKK